MYPIEQFIEFCNLKQLSPITKREYMKYYNHLPPTINSKTLMDWLKSYSSNNVARAFLRNYIEFLLTKPLPQELKVSILEFRIPRVTGRKFRKLPDRLSQSEVNTLTKAIPDMRIKLMVMVTFYGGLRASELLHILPHDFYWNDWLQDTNQSLSLKVLGKGGKERVVFIPPFIASPLYRWIREDLSKRQTAEEPIFKMSLTRWEVIIRHYSTKALGHRIHPHSLRHSTAIYLKSKGMDLVDIRDYLGHTDISTTQIYSQLSNIELKDKVSEVWNDIGL